MKVLVACEFSGVVRDAFIEQGHFAVSVDLLPTESYRYHEKWGKHLLHYQADVRHFLTPDWQWDLMIAHPPCTYLSNSGVSWLTGDRLSPEAKKERWRSMKSGAAFFKFLLDANVPRIAVENPVMHKYAVEIIGRKHDQTIQPWQFGHDESKRTCFWLKGLDPLEPTDVVKRPAGEKYSNQTPSGQNKLGPSADRWKLRSITYKGIAEAMATQWGNVE